VDEFALDIMVTQFRFKLDFIQSLSTAETNKRVCSKAQIATAYLNNFNATDK
jgi:hypothetical protein